MRDGIRIVTPRNWHRWELGAKLAAVGFAKRIADWNAANEHFYSETQRFVHVVTGDLKSSGQERVEVQGTELVAVVEYGNERVDYAQAEIDRGGDHDFMGRAWESSQPMFEETFGKTWNKVVSSWR